MQQQIAEHLKRKQNKKHKLLNGFFLLMLTVLVLLLMLLLRPAFIRLFADGYLLQGQSGLEKPCKATNSIVN